MSSLPSLSYLAGFMPQSIPPSNGNANGNHGPPKPPKRSNTVHGTSSGVHKPAPPAKGQTAAPHAPGPATTNNGTTVATTSANNTTATSNASTNASACSSTNGNATNLCEVSLNQRFVSFPTLMSKFARSVT